MKLEGMREGIEFNGTVGKRIQNVMSTFKNQIGIKRLFVTKDSKMEITFLLKGSKDDLDRLLLYLKGQLPTVDNCTMSEKVKSENCDYDYKIELVDVMVGK